MLITDLKLNNYRVPNDHQYSFVILDLFGINDSKMYVIITTLKRNYKGKLAELIELISIERTFRAPSQYMKAYFNTLVGGA